MSRKFKVGDFIVHPQKYAADKNFQGVINKINPDGEYQILWGDGLLNHSLYNAEILDTIYQHGNKLRNQQKIKDFLNKEET